MRLDGGFVSSSEPSAGKRGRGNGWRDGDGSPAAAAAVAVTMRRRERRETDEKVGEDQLQEEC